MTDGKNPDDEDRKQAAALFDHGNALRQHRRNQEAVAAFDAALALRPDYSEALNNRGNALRDLDRREEALASYDRALTANPVYERAFNNRGNVLRDLGRHEDALESYDRALAIRPDYPEASINRGNALRDLKRFAEALANYDRALALRPAWPAALNNRGLVLSDLERHDDALASFDAALTGLPNDAEIHFHRGNALLALKRHAEALTAYERALTIAPGFAKAWNNRGNALLFLRRGEAALASYDRALAIAPDDPEVLCNRGHAQETLGAKAQALANYTQATALDPNYAAALYARAQLLRDLKRNDEAIACVEHLLRVDPSFGIGTLVDLKRAACDWNGIAELSAAWVNDVREGKGAVAPFSFLSVSDSPDDQLRCARIFIGGKTPFIARRLWNGELYRHDKIRVAYLSADFHEHATAYLTAGLFESHDRSRFETTAISWGPTYASPIRTRLQAAFDRFLDVRTASDEAVAAELRKLEIDIAVNLLGFTRSARTGIFAMRPAPVQVSFLGYPGTMGTDYFDYLIADRIVIPKENAPYCTEKIVTLPDTYQPNDSKRAIAERKPSRAESGLPVDAFVFCSFNNNYKITPEIFDVWMRLLHKVERSVLWLIEDNPSAVRNLRQEAERRGVAGDRVVFAPRIGMEDHLARHRLADLFLDTLPYNAHTTASDALWAGLPLVTCTGASFPARVATSLLHAIGLPELATSSLPEYEALALSLACDKRALSKMRTKLARNRQSRPLFNTLRFTRHLEAAFTTMHERQHRGVAPASFDVSPDTNFSGPV